MRYVNGVPVLDASQITSGRLAVARLTDGSLGTLLKAQGCGVDPIYATVFSGLAKLSVGTTPPIDLQTGDLWVDTN